MIVLPFETFHVDLLRAQGVQGAQLGELSHVPASYASVAKPPGPSVTGKVGDRILVCAGMVTMTPKIGLLWALFAADVQPHMLSIHRAALRFIDAHAVRRLEATVARGFDEGCRWLDLLGFTYEGEMAGYGDGGETHLRYGRVR